MSTQDSEALFPGASCKPAVEAFQGLPPLETWLAANVYLKEEDGRETCQVTDHFGSSANLSVSCSEKRRSSVWICSGRAGEEKGCCVHAGKERWGACVLYDVGAGCEGISGETHLVFFIAENSKKADPACQRVTDSHTVASCAGLWARG